MQVWFPLYTSSGPCEICRVWSGQALLVGSKGRQAEQEQEQNEKQEAKSGRRVSWGRVRSG